MPDPQSTIQISWPRYHAALAGLVASAMCLIGLPVLAALWRGFQP